VLVADMPFGSYHASVAEGVSNAIRFVKDGGAEAVKVEGGRSRLELWNVWSTPRFRSSATLDSHRRRCIAWAVTPCREEPCAHIDELTRDSVALEHAGASLVVLEGIPREVAQRITAELTIPTIGIGAGPDCDGQILVFHDLVNLSFSKSAKFVRQYGDAAALYRAAIEGYRDDVAQRAFPSDAESYHLAKEERLALEELHDELHAGKLAVMR
jgi:3-methyl-2-oxobutanoate hydroxymethyltransferase